MPGIYLDHQATTPVDPRVVEAMLPFMTQRFANAHANTYRSATDALRAIEDARRKFASTVCARSKDVIFTSGATEANNIAIQGIAAAASKHRRRIVTQTTEHRSVLETVASLSRHGFEAIAVNVHRDGLVNLEELSRVVDDRTLLVSVMLVNNETGVIQPLRTISEICKRTGTLVHSDCAQAMGKVPIDVEAFQLDLASFSAHKAYGPKGVGALYVRNLRRAPIRPICFGGGQEGGIRPGTLPVPLCVGMGTAAVIAKLEQSASIQRAADLEFKLWRGIQRVFPGARINGHPKFRAPGCLSIRFPGHQSDALIDAWEGIEVAKGSACDATTTQSSHVLRSMRLT
ncbi:MAG: cysteine desulfurase family protein, partial [Rhodobacteraceae bacterium]|nr:cysteine desulfurase family protein [Paracoccaceae bacterium]